MKGNVHVDVYSSLGSLVEAIRKEAGALELNNLIETIGKAIVLSGHEKPYMTRVLVDKRYFDLEEKDGGRFVGIESEIESKSDVVFIDIFYVPGRFFKKLGER